MLWSRKAWEWSPGEDARQERPVTSLKRSSIYISCDGSIISEGPKFYWIYLWSSDCVSAYKYEQKVLGGGFKLMRPSFGSPLQCQVWFHSGTPFDRKKMCLLRAIKVVNCFHFAGLGGSKVQVLGSSQKPPAPIPWNRPDWAEWWRHPAHPDPAPPEDIGHK